MAKKTYAEKLRDPRWQRLRLSILSRDNFACVVCKDNANELHVHHFYYDGREPWEYPSKDLETLCKACHIEAHASYLEFERKEKDREKRIALANERVKRIRKLLPNMYDPALGYIEEKIQRIQEEAYAK